MLGQVTPNTPRSAISRHDLVGNEPVFAMPAMRMRRDPPRREFAELIAHEIERFFSKAFVDRASGGHMRDERAPVLCGVAVGEELRHRAPRAELGGGGEGAELARPCELVLAHRHAARELSEIFTETDRENELFALAEPSRLGEAMGENRQMRQSLDSGGDPGKAMKRALMLVRESRVEAALAYHLTLHRLARRGNEAASGRNGVIATFEQRGC